MKTELFIVLALIIAVTASGCIGINPEINKTGEVNNYPTENRCYDECHFSGTTCIGNEIHSCVDRDGDTCLEDVLIMSCSGSRCVDGECEAREYCGNGICGGGESCESCSQDCGYCEYYDYSRCGNGVCESGESCQNCQRDCGYCNYSYSVRCGDGYCNSYEDCQNCPNDCGRCNYGNGHSCSRDYDCWSGYCVDWVCRSSSTYCGDDECDEGETCYSCPRDCGTCRAFGIEDAYSSSEGKITRTGYNEFRLLQAGQPYSSVSIPIELNQTVEDITYSFTCRGVDNSFYASSYAINEGGYENILGFDSNEIYLRSYFATISSHPFELSNNKETGVRVEEAGEGRIRIILFVWRFPEKDMTIMCNFRVNSGYPSHSEETDIVLWYDVP